MRLLVKPGEFSVQRLSFTAGYVEGIYDVEIARRCPEILGGEGVASTGCRCPMDL